MIHDIFCSVTFVFCLLTRVCFCWWSFFFTAYKDFQTWPLPCVNPNPNPVYTCVFILMTQVRQQSEGEALCWGDYELFKIRWSLIIQHLVFKEDFELNSGFNFSQWREADVGEACCSSPCQHCRISGGSPGLVLHNRSLLVIWDHHC